MKEHLVITVRVLFDSASNFLKTPRNIWELFEPFKNFFRLSRVVWDFKNLFKASKTIWDFWYLFFFQIYKNFFRLLRTVWNFRRLSSIAENCLRFTNYGRKNGGTEYWSFKGHRNAKYILFSVLPVKSNEIKNWSYLTFAAALLA